MKTQNLETKTGGKSLSDKYEEQEWSDDADDISDLREAMMHRDATCGLGGSYSREAIAAAKGKQMDICKDCGACDEVRSIIKRMKCRKKAAKRGKHLEEMCESCGKCEPW